VLSDVLHYLQQDEQKALLDRCLSGLCPGGVLVIRDANADLRSRHRGSRLTEFFSTRLFGFNKTTGEGLSFFSPKIIREAAVTRNMEYAEIDNTRYTSNQIHVIKNNQASVHGPV
jgi:hypothetical protein